MKAKTALNEDLRVARNLAVLTPLMLSTKTRLQTSIVKISARVREARFGLSRLVCYREILLRDHLLDKSILMARKEVTGTTDAGLVDTDQKIVASTSGPSMSLASCEGGRILSREVEGQDKKQPLQYQESITRPPRREYRSDSSSQVRNFPPTSHSVYKQS